MSPDEAASLIAHRQNIGFSGFTPAGAAKTVPRAIAKRARADHEDGTRFQIGVVTGASTGNSLDGELARANAVAWRTPYQSDKDMRMNINLGKTVFFDMHLSLLQQYIRYGYLGNMDWAVVEACDVTRRGEIVLSTSVGAANTFLQQADRIIVELNRFHPVELCGFHDIYEPADPPHRREIPIYNAHDRIGSTVVKVDPRRIAAVVENDEPDENVGFREPDEVTRTIGRNVADFLAREMKTGRLPSEFLPVQSGVGNVANAVLGAMAEHPDIPPFAMFSEVIQDSVIELMKAERIRFASGTSLTVSPELLKDIYDHLDFFRSRILLRPQEITNNPEVVRRLGIISINTALEVDLFGNVNSTHVLGRNMMNGIGGSGDFTRNAYLSIFTCPSTAKGGRISAVVPQVSHMDHSEHSVQVLITEQGVADLRKKNPHMRARTMVENCVHPSYREDMDKYLQKMHYGHTPQTLAGAYVMHQQFLEHGDMRGVDWSKIWM